MLPYNRKLTASARALRRRMTPEEKHLWFDFLQKLPLTVKRQHNIENYIVDFYIAATKTVIEIDGIQHSSEEHAARDIQRDEDLAKWGITVLRYSNNSVRNNFSLVTRDILEHLGLSYSDIL